MPADGNADAFVRVFCQACGSELLFATALIGRKARCRTCGHTFRVPAIGGAQPAARKPSGRTRANLEVGAAGPEPGGALLGVEPVRGAPGDATAEADSTPRVIGDAQVAEVSGVLLFCEGLGILMVVAAVVYLLFWLLHWAVVLWLLLPVVALFGPAFGRRMLFSLTAGSVRV